MLKKLRKGVPGRIAGILLRRHALPDASLHGPRRARAAVTRADEIPLAAGSLAGGCPVVALLHTGILGAEEVAFADLTLRAAERLAALHSGAGAVIQLRTADLADTTAPAQADRLGLVVRAEVRGLGGHAAELGQALVGIGTAWIAAYLRRVTAGLADALLVPPAGLGAFVGVAADVVVRHAHDRAATVPAFLRRAAATCGVGQLRPPRAAGQERARDQPDGPTPRHRKRERPCHEIHEGRLEHRPVGMRGAILGCIGLGIGRTDEFARDPVEAATSHLVPQFAADATTLVRRGCRRKRLR